MTWEERFHPLRKEWVVVAAHRQNRPWSGEAVEEAKAVPQYLTDCYLCPGNARVSGKFNDDYDGIYVFDNDHPCVGDLAETPETPKHAVYQTRDAKGVARVVCYHSRHDLTLAELDVARVDRLLAVWQEQYRELGARPNISHVLVFENKGEVVGVSNPHPHCQVYATNFVFRTTEVEVEACREYRQKTGRVLFQDILEAERDDGRRILDENEGAVSFIPFFGRYAYEVFVAPKRSVASLADLTATERREFAEVLHRTTIRFDNLWKISFPYVMVLHQAPTDGGNYVDYHFHIEFHPPLRKPSLLKYLAGPEIGGGCFISDTSPEQKVAELRAVSTVHYKQSR
jgi:UDPglucose--hexose-1-phosphate uridylyltransferase